MRRPMRPLNGLSRRTILAPKSGGAAIWALRVASADVAISVSRAGRPSEPMGPKAGRAAAARFARRPPTDLRVHRLRPTYGRSPLVAGRQPKVDRSESRRPQVVARANKLSGCVRLVPSARARARRTFPFLIFVHLLVLRPRPTGSRSLCRPTTLCARCVPAPSLNLGRDGGCASKRRKLVAA